MIADIPNLRRRMDSRLSISVRQGPAISCKVLPYIRYIQNTYSAECCSRIHLLHFWEYSRVKIIRAHALHYVCSNDGFDTDNETLKGLG